MERKTLSNGLMLVIINSNNVSYSTVTFNVKSGTNCETRRMIGINRLISNIMTDSVIKNLAKQNVEPHVISNTNLYGTYWHFTIETKSISILLKTFSNCWQKPLADHEVENEKTALKKMMQIFQLKPIYLSEKMIIEKVFQNQPMFLNMLDISPVLSLKTQEINDYIKRQWRPANLIVTVQTTTDASRAKIPALVESVFGEIVNPTIAEYPCSVDAQQAVIDRVYKARTQPESWIIENPKLKTAYVNIIYPVDEYFRKSQVTFILMMTIIYEHFDNNPELKLIKRATRFNLDFTQIGSRHMIIDFVLKAKLAYELLCRLRDFLETFRDNITQQDLKTAAKRMIIGPTTYYYASYPEYLTEILCRDGNIENDFFDTDIRPLYDAQKLYAMTQNIQTEHVKLLAKKVFDVRHRSIIIAINPDDRQEFAKN